MAAHQHCVDVRGEKAAVEIAKEMTNMQDGYSKVMGTKFPVGQEFYVQFSSWCQGHGVSVAMTQSQGHLV